jgi:hypothetical protein
VTLKTKLSACVALKVLLMNGGFAISDFFAAKVYWLKLELTIA